MLKQGNQVFKKGIASQQIEVDTQRSTLSGLLAHFGSGCSMPKFGGKVAKSVCPCASWALIL